MFDDGPHILHLLFSAGCVVCAMSACGKSGEEFRGDAGRMEWPDAGPSDAGVDAETDASDAPLVTMRFAKIVAGSHFACGISSEGRVRCWGDEAPAESPTFTGAVLNLCSFEQHLCALTENGTIECLDFPDTLSPPPTEADFVALECMDVNTCARRASGERVCWGTREAGDFATSKDFIRYDGANRHACGLREDGSFECFGVLPFGLGEPREESFKDLASGGNFNCGLTQDGAIDCWGQDANGTLDAPSETGFVAIDASFRSGCALRANGTAACWGASAYWDTTPSIPLSSVSVGRGFACGLTAAEGRGLCWGIPSGGQTDVPLEES